MRSASTWSQTTTVSSTLRARGLTVLAIHRLPHRAIPFFAAACVSGPASAMDSFLVEDFDAYAVPAGVSGRRRGNM